MAISIINVSTRLTLAKQGTVDEARIVLGAAAPTALRAVAAEAVLMGNELSEDRVEEAAIAASKEISPITDVRASRNYREKMAHVLVRRALLASRDELDRSGSND
jgi:xanthine dehydrogenase iron-sulfur cluster and FAD-binding subunit A